MFNGHANDLVITVNLLQALPLSRCEILLLPKKRLNAKKAKFVLENGDIEAINQINVRLEKLNYC